jgi:hypothetical protein
VIVLSTKSCSVRKTVILEQEKNVIEFCLHYCLHWNISLVFHFPSCITRQRMSRLNYMFEPSASQCIHTSFSIINRVLSRSDFTSGSLVCLHYFVWARCLFDWRSITQLDDICEHRAGFLFIIGLCDYRDFFHLSIRFSYNEFDSVKICSTSRSCFGNNYPDSVTFEHHAKCIPIRLVLLPWMVTTLTF